MFATPMRHAKMANTTNTTANATMVSVVTALTIFFSAFTASTESSFFTPNAMIPRLPSQTLYGPGRSSDAGQCCI
jgi:hypothetical protein